MTLKTDLAAAKDQITNLTNFLKGEEEAHTATKTKLATAVRVVDDLLTKLAAAEKSLAEWKHKDKTDATRRKLYYMRDNNLSSANDAPARTNPGVVGRAEGESNAEYVRRMQAQRIAAGI